MALGKCKECGRECAKTAKVCPGCGVANPVKGSAGAAVLGLVFVGLVVVYVVVTSGSKPSAAVANPIGAVADLGMDSIKRKVVEDAIAQYDIAKRNGSAMDRCAHASGVKAAVMQAQDEPGFVRWKKIEGEDCAAAGVPVP